MFCPNCGTKLPDNSRFCTECGTRLAEFALDPEPVVNESTVAEEVSESAAPASAAVESAVPDDAVNESTTPAAAAIESAAPVVTVNEYTAPTGKVKTKKDKKGLPLAVKIAIFAAAALLVAAAAFFGIKFFTGNKNAYVTFVADENKGKIGYYYIKDLKGSDPIEISSSSITVDKSVSSAYFILSKLSPDGKYFYYYSDWNSSEYTGTLCRAELGKLKDDPDENDDYIEKIASEVTSSFRVLDNGTLVYLTGDRTLYADNVKTSEQLAEKVRSFYTDGSNTIIYLSENDDGGLVLYSVSADDPDSSTELAAGVSKILRANDFNDIVFIKEESDGIKSLYTVGIGKDAEKLAEDVEIAENSNDVIIYAVKTGSVNLYDYVNDSKAESDNKAKEPDKEDYVIPEYSYVSITGDDLKEADYPELYTSCTERLYWFRKASSSGSFYSIKSALNVNWSGNNAEAFVKDLNDFVTKYEKTANEDGYIKVTDDVKKALQKISSHADYDDWEWLWMCFSYEQTGTTYDYEKYDKDYDAYTKIKARIDLREELQDEKNNYTVSSIYKYADGKQTLVSENALFIYNSHGITTFNTIDMITDKVDIEDISSPNDVKDLIQTDKNGLYLYTAGAETPAKMSAEDNDKLNEMDIEGTFGLGTAIYLLDSDGVFYSVALDNGSVGELETICENAKPSYIGGSTIYYYTDLHSEDDKEFGDLYSYKDGKSELVAKDIYTGSTPSIYEDGVILAYASDKNDYGYSLTMFDAKGEATDITDGSSIYRRIDSKNILYLSSGSDNKLYSHDGKERGPLMQKNVMYYWSLNYMAPESLKSISSYFK